MLHQVETYADTVAYSRMIMILWRSIDPGLRISQNARDIARALMEMFGPGSGSHDCCPTYKQIANYCRMSVRSIGRGLAELRRMLVIGWEPRKGRNHVQSSNRFWLNVTNDLTDLRRLDQPTVAEALAEPFTEVDTPIEVEAEVEVVVSLCSAKTAEPSPLVIESTNGPAATLLGSWSPPARKWPTPRVQTAEAREKDAEWLVKIREARVTGQPS